MKNSYKEYKQLNLTEMADDIRRFWEENGIFQKSLDNRSKDNAFVFFEGPPSANGTPGIHHVMARTIKDIDFWVRAAAYYPGANRRAFNSGTIH